jgi:hypothetical protein
VPVSHANKTETELASMRSRVSCCCATARVVLHRNAVMCRVTTGIVSINGKKEAVAAFTECDGKTKSGKMKDLISPPLSGCSIPSFGSLTSRPTSLAERHRRPAPTDTLSCDAARRSAHRRASASIQKGLRQHCRPPGGAGVEFCKTTAASQWSASAVRERDD